MTDEQNKNEIKECKKLLENQSLGYNERANIEAYLKSIEKNGN